MNLIHNKGFNNLVEARHGYLLYNKNDKYVGRSIEEYGEFSELEGELFKQIISQDDIIIEVGANIGAHTIMMSNIIGNSGFIYAFEPQRIVYQTLNANIALNSITNVKTYDIGLGSENQHVLIPNINYNAEGNFGGVSINKYNEGEKVEVKPLDDLFKNLKRLKLIKIDVEGMEKEVLLGGVDLIKRLKPIMYIENDRVDKSKDLIEYLWELDYVLYWHTPKLYNQDNFFHNKNNIFKNIVSFNMLSIHKSMNSNIRGFVKIEDSSFHPLSKK